MLITLLFRFKIEVRSRNSKVYTLKYYIGINKLEVGSIEVEVAIEAY